MILLDDYYVKNETTNRFEVVSDLNALYEGPKGITLTITGIAREKEDAIFTLLNEGIKYHPDLLVTYLDHAKQSEIGIAQTASSTNVITGLIIDDQSKTDFLRRLGVDDTASQIRIYPRDFVAKSEISTYLDDYNTGLSEDDQIIYTDLASVVTELTGDLISGVSYVLIAFSAISLIVSSIMIGIITWSFKSLRSKTKRH